MGINKVEFFTIINMDDHLFDSDTSVLWYLFSMYLSVNNRNRCFSLSFAVNPLSISICLPLAIACTIVFFFLFLFFLTWMFLANSLKTKTVAHARKALYHCSKLFCFEM